MSSDFLYSLEGPNFEDRLTPNIGHKECKALPAFQSHSAQPRPLWTLPLQLAGGSKPSEKYESLEIMITTGIWDSEQDDTTNQQI